MEREKKEIPFEGVKNFLQSGIEDFSIPKGSKIEYVLLKFLEELADKNQLGEVSSLAESHKDFKIWLQKRIEPPNDPSS